MVDIIKKNNAMIRQVLFLALLLLMGAVMIGQLKFFIGAFLGAFTFYIVFRRLIFFMTERHKWRPWLAALVIVVGISVVLLWIGVLVGEIIAREIADVDTARLLQTARESVPKVNEIVGFTLISPDVVQASTTVLTKILNAVLNTTYSFAANILMTVIVLYFMLTHARRLENHAGKYIPFRGESRAELLDDITSIIYSNAVGIPVTMLAQGLVAALLYWALGVPNVAFWAFLTALCGLIPMVGTAIISVPLGIWMIVDGHLWQGIVLILCGILVIANVDNLARIVLNQKISNTHPLIVIFGVILGIPLFGFWGIIFGPLMISLFLLLVRIYYKEYKLVEPDPVETPSDSASVSVSVSVSAPGASDSAAPTSVSVSATASTSDGATTTPDAPVSPPETPEKK